MNNEGSVEDSIKSILSQTFYDFELLIVDDYSNDDTFGILKEYEKIDNRVKIYKNDENIGLTRSLNKLISYSKGTLIARQDADDISHKSRFVKQVNYFEDSEYEFCLTRAKSMQGNNIVPKYSYYLPSNIVSSYKNPFIHGTLIIRKKSIVDLGCYDERFYYAQDYKLFKDLLDKKIKYKYIKQPLYYLNMENNISTIKKVEQKYYFDCARKNIKPSKLVK